MLAPGRAAAGGCERVAVWRDGHAAGTICRAEAAERGLTVVELGDDWVPRVLEPAPDGSAPEVRATYLALAQERLADAGLDGQLASSDRYLELFGIPPTLTIVRARLADDVRHQCHDAIDDTAFTEAPASAAAVRTAQAHLTCDGLFLAPPVPGTDTWQTSDAIARFQRGAMILPTGVLDEPTRDALAEDSRERDFVTVLRVLRERVIAATGLLEDGTAGGGEGTVLGRELEPEATWRVRGYAPLPDAAPDLVSAATEAAARALGWTDPDATRASLDALLGSGRRSLPVALPLPAPPPYHGPAMELEIVIDRGDVWYRRSAPATARRPALVVYARDGERRIALVRWPTTIGGWQPQQVAGELVTGWKESPPGARVWRDLLVGPRWLPADTIPDRELVRSTDHGTVLAREQFGPSYRAAFGLLAFVHLRPTAGGGFEDESIRTQATGNLASLGRGVSHGCHRLLGLYAIRLADFLLAHHDHVVRGDEPTSYHRIVRHGGAFPIAIDTLGYRIELVPPIPVEVLRGRIHR